MKSKCHPGGSFVCILTLRQMFLLCKLINSYLLITGVECVNVGVLLGPRLVHQRGLLITQCAVRLKTQRSCRGARN